MKSVSQEMPLLNFQQLGEGEPLLLVHGLFGSGRNFMALARRLAEQYQVILPDLRNHGQSFHAEEMNYDVLAGDLLRLLDYLKVRRCHVLGHSMGGKTSMWFTLKHPERVRSLIVADIAPVPYSHNYNPEIDAMRSLDLVALKDRRAADQHLKEAGISNPSLRGFFLHNLDRQEPEGWQWRINLPVLQASQKDIIGFPETFGLKPFTGTAMFVYGLNSDYVLPEYSGRIHELFPHSEVTGIPGAGHWIHAEQAERFYTVVQKFLSQCGSLY